MSRLLVFEAGLLYLNTLLWRPSWSFVSLGTRVNCRPFVTFFRFAPALYASRTRFFQSGGAIRSRPTFDEDRICAICRLNIFS